MVEIHILIQCPLKLSHRWFLMLTDRKDCGQALLVWWLCCHQVVWELGKISVSLGVLFSSSVR